MKRRIPMVTPDQNPPSGPPPSQTTIVSPLTLSADQEIDPQHKRAYPPSLVSPPSPDTQWLHTYTIQLQHNTHKQKQQCTKIRRHITDTHWLYIWPIIGLISPFARVGRYSNMTDWPAYRKGRELTLSLPFKN